LILEKSRFITGAEAGSLYVVEPSANDPATPCLRFKLSQNDAVSFAAQEFTLPLSLRSIAGASALIKQPINTPDVYALDESKPYRFDSSFDERTGYRTRSLLTVPLISAQDEVIGVIQLINRREQRALEPFDARSEELAITVAAQAGIALENALLYAEIRHIFEGFVRASVQAIEQRDPTTSGHSQRVSIFSCALAEQVDRIDRGPYRDTRFSLRDMRELEYASLLHDFGKIGVREEVLVKAKKLYRHQAEAIRGRVAYAIKCAELDLFREKLRLGDQANLEALELAFEARRHELQEAWRTIEIANEPSVLRQEGIARIAELGQLIYPGIDGQLRPLLDPDEVVALQIPRGSLSPREYDQIRSHVVHTYNFLSRIPWGKSMANLPLIAGAHHERIDGSGYPNGWRAERIPVQSKIMAIADVYDALTAADRPYKRALPSARAFEILEAEVRDGHFDEELVRLFREAKIYKSAPPPRGLD
ncbi:MAG TPA: HD domain-containing phosphohydrolase, partial [Polyangiales bacterium]|nr:HD domain-containing phosphohydrolase [Polyangiales bacterium]